MGVKISKSEIQDALSKYGFVLLDKDYAGLCRKHTIMDESGYLYSTKLGNLINGGRMPEKYRFNNPYTQYNANRTLEMQGSKTRLISQEYTNAHELLLFKCGVCGCEYKASLNHVLSKGQTLCQSCSKIEKGKRHRVPYKSVVKEFVKSGLKPLFTEYIGCDDKLLCEDIDGNILSISYRSLAQRNKAGYSTYSIRYSRYEMLVKEYLDSLGVKYTPQYMLEMCRDKKPLPFDFAVFSDNMEMPEFLIEVDGQQHYFQVNFTTPNSANYEDRFFTIKRHDAIKSKYCDNNGIVLLRIPFYDIENGSYKETIKKYITFPQNAVA